MVLLLNDNCYGMIKWKQQGMHFGDYGLDLNNPDFVKYAEAYGAHGHRITQVHPSFRVMRNSGRCLGAGVVASVPASP